MKHLFNDDDRYTDEALSLDAEIQHVMTPIIKKYFDKGYSVRDIEYILHGTVTCVCLDKIMDENLNLFRKSQSVQ